MKNQTLVSLKDKNKNKLKCRLLQFLFGALRVKVYYFEPEQALSVASNQTLAYGSAVP